ncbi:MAG: MFS transporter [Candidatus Binatia bacterium]
MSHENATRFSPAPGSAVWNADHRLLTFGLLLVISITAFEALAVATVLPATATDLGGGASLGWYGWVFSGFMLANLVGIPAAGLLADRGGPVRPFVVGCVFFAFGLLVAGLAQSMPVVVAGRIAQGFGAGALSSIAYVAVARGYAPVDQPRMLALLASAWVVPGLIGPSAAAALAHQFGWRSVFLFLVPVTAIAAAFAMKGLRELAPARNGDAPAMSMRAAVQLALGTGIAFVGTEASGLLLAGTLVVVGVAIALPALRRLMPPGTLHAAPGAPAALAAKGLATFAFFGAEAFLPLALTVVRAESMVMAGLALTAGTLAWTAGAWMQERLVAHVSPALLVRSGMAMLAVAIAGAAGVLFVPAPGAMAIASWTLAGLGIGVAYSTTTLIVFDRTAQGGEGNAASSLQLVNVLGVAFGTGIGGAVLGVATGLGHSRTIALVAIDVVMIAAAVIAFVAAGRTAKELSSA